MSTPPEDDPLVTQGEDRMRRAWFRSLTRWLDRARGDVLPAGAASAPQNLAQHRAYWGELMTSDVVPVAGGILARVRNRMTGRPEPQAVTGADEARYLNEVGNRLSHVPDEVYALLVREIEEGLTRQESIPAIRDRVQAVMTATATPYWPNRATVVARTEVQGAVQAGAYFGALRAAQERGDFAPRKVWLCVAPDTSIVVPGSIHYAARRHYVGSLVRVTTASGAVVSVTPEHPVLTGRGWLPAHLLDESDHLFRLSGADSGGAPDVEDSPPVIGEVVDTFMESEAVQVRTVRMGVDLHSDVVGGEIEVVATTGDLATYVQPLARQNMGHLSFMDADSLAESLLHAESAPFQGCGGHGASERLGPDESRLPGLEFRGLAGCSDHSSSALVPDGCLGAPQDVVDREGGAPGFAANCGGAQAGQVEPDDVVGIEIVPFSGHVYDLTTSGGWYVANSLLIHNSTVDDRTRPTHKAADRQSTLLAEPFRVGGAQLLFPGDPRGPADTTINCRCGVAYLVDGETLDWRDRQEP